MMESVTAIVPSGRGVVCGGNAISNSSPEPVTTGGSFWTQNTRSIFNTANAWHASWLSESLAKLNIRMNTVAMPNLLSQANRAAPNSRMIPESDPSKTVQYPLVAINVAGVRGVTVVLPTPVV